MNDINDNAIELLEKLIICKSITPNDAGCQEIIGDFLKNIGFSVKEKNMKGLII